MLLVTTSEGSRSVRRVRQATSIAVCRRVRPGCAPMLPHASACAVKSVISALQSGHATVCIRSGSALAFTPSRLAHPARNSASLRRFPRCRRDACKAAPASLDAPLTNARLRAFSPAVVTGMLLTYRTCRKSARWCAITPYRPRTLLLRSRGRSSTTTSDAVASADTRAVAACNATSLCLN